jgi:hypothetical protein
MATKTAMDLDEPAEERDEPKLEALPRFGREVFSYLEPRVGLDGLKYFGQCASCQSFTTEAAMGGAVHGNRCVLFGSDFPVTDDDSCDRYTPLASGLPCASLEAFNAAELRKGLPGAVRPYDVGYKSKCTAQCGRCKFADAEEPDLPPGKLECELYELLNREYPSIFAIIETVDRYGGCALFQEPPPIEATMILMPAARAR